MPVPSGSRSNRRIGNGFRISKTRKSIRPARNVFHAKGTAMRVTSCPATSSMTTNWGSSTPATRATRVAAGMPMSVTKAAATMVAQVRLAAGMWELANHQTMTVATDPQVPGPGLRRPAPKKVATSVAQSGARGERPRLPAGRRRYVGRGWGCSGVCLTAHLRVGSGLFAFGGGLRDYVGASGPLAEVDLSGSGRCRKGSRGRWPSSVSCRSGNGV